MCRSPLNYVLMLIAALAPGSLPGQAVEVVAVCSEKVQRTILLPGEIQPFQKVAIHARANGYVERVLVDRGSAVREGQLLATLTAPELAAGTAEAESKIGIAEAAEAEAEARLAGVEATYERLKRASATPGAIAGNELVQAQRTVEAARASVRAAESSIRSAQAAVATTKQSEAWLQVTAPFSGTVTQRFVHPGALVGPGNGSAGSLFELEQISTLRLIVAVPETEIAAVRTGASVEFRVPAYPGRKFTGRVARIDRSLDPKTRTMAVELDVVNRNSVLSPGMYPEVSWPAGGTGESLLVPATAVVTTTERTFVIRANSGRAEWVNVKKGQPAGDQVQVMGPLQAGDKVLRRGSDEIREGAALQVK
jgi:membrane fusion protein (multidrug efflux system)